MPSQPMNCQNNYCNMPNAQQIDTYLLEVGSYLLEIED